jgi:cyclopropane-fatty-acyl-phospholipid synthase
MNDPRPKDCSGTSLVAGASPAAIRSHYDVGDDFYRLWLDGSLTYSCALWETASSSLEEAQAANLDLHIRTARVAAGCRVLDVGCGWGSLLRRLADAGAATGIVGLTLSESQAKYIESLGLPRTEVRVEHWRDHAPKEPYDAIISIGAMEHFVGPDDSTEKRIAIYRQFFRHCHSWLRPGSWMSLQTIAYGVGGFVRGAISEIFPESDLPRLREIAAAAEGVFDIARLRNDQADYARTCRTWAERLDQAWAEAVSIVGEQAALHFRAYLLAAARGFDQGVFVLYRMALRRTDDRIARIALARG